MSRIVQVLKPTSELPATLNQINSVFRQINQENRFEVVSSGDVDLPTVNITPSGAGAFENNDSVTVTHNLGFTPTVFAYLLVGNRIPLNYFQNDVDAWSGVSHIDYSFWNITVLANESTVAFRSYPMVIANASGGSVGFTGVPVKYLLLRETAGATT